MSVLLFEGPAGTGKTTNLVSEARSHLAAHPLQPEQRVLSLTKYHGSRRRMEDRLTAPDGLGRAVDCMTIDSFAWSVVWRWRSLARGLGIKVCRGDFAAIASAVGQILHQPAIAQWVTRRYPLVLVDELQDCKGGEIEVLDGLAPHARLLCAADRFQDLSGAMDCEAVSWAESVGEVVSLTKVHRTSARGLLEAAAAIRNGFALKPNPRFGFECVGVAKAPMGGGTVSWRIKSWSRLGDIAIISPSRPDTSPFVDKLLEWIRTRRAKSSRSSGSGSTAGPYPVDWEADEESMCNALNRALQIPLDPAEHLELKAVAERAREVGAHDLAEWVGRQHRIAGRTVATANEIAEAIRQVVHWRRAFGHRRKTNRVALTVHQAKNREFESVIVLWPLRLAQDYEQQRRLLYNAVTRAKGRALVIVEDPYRQRLRQRLFAGGT